MVALLRFLRVALSAFMLLVVTVQAAVPVPSPLPAQTSQPEQSTPISLSQPEPDTSQPASTSQQTHLASAFTRDEPLADGRRMLTIFASPVQFQAEDGSWQPIDPRFTAEEDGFTNFTNALRVSAGSRTATINLRNGDTRVQWQSQSLVLSGAGGATTPLAKALDPAAAQVGTLADGNQTVRYNASWTLPEIVEVIRAAPGAAEQSLVIASRPAVTGSQAEATTLDMTAILRLSPAASLFANGSHQTGSFTTSERVEIRDAAGQTTLVLDPVIAYEQDDPAIQTSGQYTFTPNGEGEWQVAVQTPWAWWDDPARTYPAVLDPTMKILSPITTAQLCSYDSSAPCPLTGTIEQGTGYEMIYVGRSYMRGTVSALIRFDNLPTLPPGYVIEQADLLVAPKNFLTGSLQSKQLRVWEVTSAWDPATVYYLNNDPTHAPAPLGLKAVLFGVKPPIPVKAQTYVTRFHLQTGPTGFVSNWLNGSGNYGLLLDEPVPGNCTACTDYLHIYTTPLWTKDDIRNLDPDKPFPVSASEKSGIMLQITYAPPTLALGQPVFSALPTFDEKNLADAYHAYLPPSSNSTWTAVAVKGLDEVQTNEGTFDKAAGNLRLGRGCTNPFAAGCVTKSSEGDFNKRPNFILARGNPANTDLEAWLYPANPETPANQNLDAYMISAVASQNLSGNPTITPGTHITRTVQMSTEEIMQVYNLNLQANTRVGVRVHATTIDPASEIPTDMPYIDARLYPPAASGQSLVKDLDGQFIGGHNFPGVYEIGKVKVGASQGGTWALALEYFGDVDPTIGEPPITYTVPLTMSLELEFIGCASNAIPTQNGCLTVKHPSPSLPYMDVGNFRVFNQSGFGNNGTMYWTNPPSPSNPEPPYIVWKADWLAGLEDRWIGVAPIVSSSAITFDTIISNHYFNIIGNAWLASDATGSVEIQEIFIGGATGYPDPAINPSDPTFGRIIPAPLAVYPAPPLTPSDAAAMRININVDRQVAEASTTLKRQVKTTPLGLEDFNFKLKWEVQAEGYAASLANQALTPVGLLPNDAQVASLTLLFGANWTMDYEHVPDPSGRFTFLRNLPGSYGDNGLGTKVSAPASLGSNWKGVTALLLPVGNSLEEGAAACPGDCLDIRAANDTLAVPNRTWGLPDLVISGQAQTLFFNKPGELDVFSTDHPNAAEALAIPFSFRTFEGDVTVDVKVCPNSGSPEKVVVITGKSKIALPGLGSDTNPSTMIKATFILCETALRQVSMQFQGPPDIPAGSTGILVNMVKGDVQIGPSNTKIDFDLEYHDNSDIVDGEGSVSINTAGLFDLQTSGEVLTKVVYTGHAWVSWNPLDVGVDVTAWYSNWLTGKVHAHLWKGQGWQNKYSWLPNNDATHFAGSIAASIGIDAGQAFSWEFIEIPPWDITFSITVAFGQFCSSSGCSKYEWGIKGKFEVIGYDVGFFYGFESGFDFILGSDGHVLIDQYGSNQPAGSAALDAQPTSAGKVLAVSRMAAADPLAPTALVPLNVTAFTGSFFAGLTWSQGAPTLTLIRPDAVEITPANALTYGATVVVKPASIQYGVAHPMPGAWQAKIDSITADNNYHFAWFANKKIPEIQLLSPAGTVNMPNNNTPYPLSWSVPAIPAGVDLRLSLYYTATNSTAQAPGQSVSGVIRENIPVTNGSYTWDLSSLAYGDYQVYARVYSGQPGSEPIEPEPTQYGTNQIPGEAWVWAPGVIHLVDSNPPATPTSPDMVPITDGFWACWVHNTEKDLSGYVLRYQSPDVFGNYHQHDLRIHAEVAGPNLTKQCARLGGFNAGENIMVQIASYDASGNLSAFSNLNEAVADSGAPSDAPSPGELSVVVVATNQVELSWPVPAPRGGGVWLYTSPGRPFGYGRAAPPVNLVDTNVFVADTLVPGFMYYFAVQTYDDMGRLSPLSFSLPVLVSDLVDDDQDGMPDDWEAAHEVSDPSLDEDGDGLPNADELAFGTHPRYADTDGDGISDGTEIAGGSSPLDPKSTPATFENFDAGLLPLPDLSVSPDRLTFHAYTGGPNPDRKVVNVLNLGGGTLAPVIGDNAAWLDTTVLGNELRVSVNKTGMPPGHYQALITIAGAPGSLTQNSPQTVSINLWLLQGQPPAPELKVYLPLVRR